MPRPGHHRRGWTRHLVAEPGRHTGEFLGFAATGRTVEYVSHEFYRIAGGLIAEEWICSDMATLFRQLS